MLVHINRKELLSIAVQVAKAVPKGETVQELAGIHLEANERQGLVTLTATNHEVAIRSSLYASVERGGSAVIKAPLLCGILEKLPENMVDLECIDGGRMTAQSGPTDYCVSVLPGEKYPMPELPFPEDTVPITGIRTLCRRVAFAVSDDKTKPVFTCVKLSLGSDGLRAVGCNGACMTEAHGDPDCKGRISLLIPVTSLQMLASIARDTDVYEMGITGKTVVFWDGTLLFSARLVEGAFLDENKVFGALKPPYVVQIQAEELALSVEAVSAVAFETGRMEIGFQPHGLLLRCVTPFGSSAVPVPAAVASAPPQPLYFDFKKLLDGLRVLRGTIELSFSREGHMLIEAEGYRFMLMGMRPPKPNEVKTTTQTAKKPPKKERPAA